MDSQQIDHFKGKSKEDLIRVFNPLYGGKMLPAYALSLLEQLTPIIERVAGMIHTLTEEEKTVADAWTEFCGLSAEKSLCVCVQIEFHYLNLESENASGIFHRVVEKHYRIVERILGKCNKPEDHEKLLISLWRQYVGLDDKDLLQYLSDMVQNR